MYSTLSDVNKFKVGILVFIPHKILEKEIYKVF